MPDSEPGAGEVLIKVAACGLCHSDLHYIDHGVPTFQPGEMVVVVGCGGIGVNAVQIAVAMGARVIGVALSDERLDWARKCGAAETINPRSDPDYPKTVRRMSDGGVDVAIEAIGSPATQQQAFDALRPCGRLILLGCGDKEVALNASRIMYRELAVIGTLG